MVRPIPPFHRLLYPRHLHFKRVRWYNNTRKERTDIVYLQAKARGERVIYIYITFLDIGVVH